MTNRLCSVHECGRVHYCRSWCVMHYERWRRHGDPAVSLKPSRPTPVQRFTSRVTISDRGCLEWTGSTNPDGYGRMQVDGVVVMAHRFAYQEAHGEIPAGMLVCHHCDNPPCCNPEHLFLGSVGDNAEDMVSKGRSLSRDRNPAARLTAQQYDELERRAAAGEPKAHIARDLGVTPTAIGNYLKRRPDLMLDHLLSVPDELVTT